MTDEELNRFVHEEVMGKKGQITASGLYDLYTGSLVTYLEHNEHWGELAQWSYNQSWWDDFVEWYECDRNGNLTELYIYPRSLPEHIAEYLKREVGK